jgi:putative thioredoxin
VSLLEDDFETALAQLLDILHRDRQFRHGAARTGINALLQLLGRDHPLTREYRPQVLDALG